MPLVALRNELAAAHYMKAVDKKKYGNTPLKELAKESLFIANAFVESIAEFDAEESNWHPHKEDPCAGAQCSEMCGPCTGCTGCDDLDKLAADEDKEMAEVGAAVLAALRETFPEATIVTAALKRSEG